MRHINDQTLDQLLADSLDEQQERELETHIQQCPACGARLREWEALFPQIRGVAPAGEEPTGDIVMPATRSSVVILPEWTPPTDAPHAPRPRPSPLWIGVAVLAVVAAWLAVRGGNSEAGPDLATYEQGLPNVDTMAGALGSGLGDSSYPSAFADSAQVPAVQTPVTEPGAQESIAIPALSDSVDRIRQQDTVQFPVKTDSESAETAALPTEFTRVSLGDAIARLGGSIRLIDGLSPETVEIAGGSVLPGADPSRLVVRIIYAGPDGRIILDQQRLNRTGSAEPDIAVNTAQSGVSVAQWVDGKGYWISLACRTGQQSLLAIASRIRESQ